MARYKMNDGKIVDSEKAAKTWQEDTRWDGHNHISVPTGSQWHHETMHRSSKGRYWIERTSQGGLDSANWIDDADAAAWLLENGHDIIPAELQDTAAELIE